jgi:hypothetical protein
VDGLDKGRAFDVAGCTPGVRGYSDAERWSRTFAASNSSATNDDAYAQRPARTVRQERQVMRRITPLIAKPITGSATCTPSATTTAEAATPRET